MTSLVNPNRLILLLLLLVSSLSACKKNNDVTALDAAASVAGRYTFSELSYGGRVVSAADSDLRGTITLTRQSASSVDMVIDLRIKSTNDEFVVQTVNGVQLATQGELTTLRYQGDQLAQIKGNKLTIEGDDADGVPFAVTATK
ncbi:hypothetical protein [Fibrella forsythiae]|uniref:Lipoprotein n=1 Tax=Fibrella forsythiae TaxID=2817061 RepID=A0ABS3JS88_9BACT|nr:hypothetical protein [Fibrella forsythiae]MBO0952890.1 hypothetical protein [Fibrella forsythiae]